MLWNSVHQNHCNCTEKMMVLWWFWCVPETIPVLQREFWWILFRNVFSPGKCDERFFIVRVDLTSYKNRQFLHYKRSRFSTHHNYEPTVMPVKLLYNSYFCKHFTKRLSLMVFLDYRCQSETISSCVKVNNDFLQGCHLPLQLYRLLDGTTESSVRAFETGSFSFWQFATCFQDASFHNTVRDFLAASKDFPLIFDGAGVIHVTRNLLTGVSGNDFPAALSVI